MVLLHLVEITVWALFYVWTGAMPELQTAVYFSAVTTRQPATGISCCRRSGGWSAPSKP